jgi:hypothetical protein
MSTWAILTIIVFMPHVAMLRSLAVSNSFTIATKAQTIVGLYASLWTNFDFVSSLTIITLSLLFGVNLVLITWLFRVKKSASLKSLFSSGSGTLFGLLGVGCVACGSIALTSLLPFIGAGTLIALLPYGGYEIQWLAIVVLVYSGYRLRKELKKPLVCEVTPYA